MIWDAGTGVFNLTCSSGLPTDSIVTSPDKYGVFTSYSDTTTFLASYFPSPSSDPFSLASSTSYPSYDTFSWPPLLPTLPLTHFRRLPHLTLLPLKYISWSLPDCLNFNVIDLLPFDSFSLLLNRHSVVFLFIFIFW